MLERGKSPLAIGFVKGGRQSRVATWREENPADSWCGYKSAALIACDKARFDVFWLKSDSFEDSDNLSEQGVLAAEIVEDLGATLEPFRLSA